MSAPNSRSLNSLSDDEAEALLDRLRSGAISPTLRAKLDRVRRALSPITPQAPRIEGEAPEVEDGSSLAEAKARARLPVVIGGGLAPSIFSGREPRAIRRITLRHRKVVMLHVEGLSHKEIGAIVGLVPGSVGAILSNPAIKPILARIYSEYDELIRGLKPLVYESLRDTLRNGSRGDKLKAIDRWGKITGEFKDEGSRADTAEEVVRMLLKARHENADGSADERTVEVSVGA